MTTENIIKFSQFKKPLYMLALVKFMAKPNILERNDDRVLGSQNFLGGLIVV